MAGIKPSELANLDAQISAQLDLLRHSNTVEAEILALLQIMRAELIAKLAEGNLTEFGKARIEKMLKESNAVIEGYFERAQAILYPSLEQSAKVGATSAARTGNNTYSATAACWTWWCVGARSAFFARPMTPFARSVPGLLRQTRWAIRPTLT